MKPYLFKKIVFLIFLLFLLTPFLTEAITFENPFIGLTFKKLIDAIADFIFWVAIAIAPIMIIIAAFYFLTSGGNPEKVNKAKKIILFTVIGLIIILLGRGIPGLIELLLFGPKPPSGCSVNFDNSVYVLSDPLVIHYDSAPDNSTLVLADPAGAPIRTWPVLNTGGKTHPTGWGSPIGVWKATLTGAACNESNTAILLSTCSVFFSKNSYDKNASEIMTFSFNTEKVYIYDLLDGGGNRVDTHGGTAGSHTKTYQLSPASIPGIWTVHLVDTSGTCDTTATTTVF